MYVRVYVHTYIFVYIHTYTTATMSDFTQSHSVSCTGGRPHKAMQVLHWPLHCSPAKHGYSGRRDKQLSGLFTYSYVHQYKNNAAQLWKTAKWFLVAHTAIKLNPWPNSPSEIKNPWTGGLTRWRREAGRWAAQRHTVSCRRGGQGAINPPPLAVNP